MPHPSLQELLNNATALPSIPRIVHQVLKELDNEDPNPRNVVMLVSTDPVLTARIIKLANSAMFATRHGIHSLADAVNLLGFTQLRALVTAAALASSFKAVPGVNLEQFWRYSLNTALVCKTLARNFGVNEGAAFTAGLVHAVGELILHLGAPYSMGMLSSIQFTDLSRRRHENEILGYNFINVSAAFVKNWDFPEVISQAIDAWCNRNLKSIQTYSA